jgi:hypothetical protein
VVLSEAAQEQQLLQQAQHMGYSTGPQQYLPFQQQTMMCLAGTQLPQQQSLHARTAAPACASVGWDSAPSYQLAFGRLSISNTWPPAQQAGGTAGLQAGVGMQGASLPMAHAQLGGIAAAVTSLDEQLQAQSLAAATSGTSVQQQQLLQMT